MRGKIRRNFSGGGQLCAIVFQARKQPVQRCVVLRKQKIAVPDIIKRSYYFGIFADIKFAAFGKHYPLVFSPFRIKMHIQILGRKTFAVPRLVRMSALNMIFAAPDLVRDSVFGEAKRSRKNHQKRFVLKKAVNVPLSLGKISQ